MLKQWIQQRLGLAADTPDKKSEVSKLQSAVSLPVHVQRQPKRKQARAQLRERAIHITVPKHWSHAVAEEASDKLAKQVQHQHQQSLAQVEAARHSLSPHDFLSFEQSETFQRWVDALNAQTLEAPLKAVRIGSSRYSRLAQLNTQTRVMTVSRFCLQNVPKDALRYLVLHELAHCFEANHSSRFWAHVAQFCPDYREQQRCISAFHYVNSQWPEYNRPLLTATH